MAIKLNAKVEKCRSMRRSETMAVILCLIFSYPSMLDEFSVMWAVISFVSVLYDVVVVW